MPRRNKFATIDDVLRDVTDPNDVFLRQLILDVVAMVKAETRGKKGKGRYALRPAPLQELESDDEQTP